MGLLRKVFSDFLIEKDVVVHKNMKTIPNLITTVGIVFTFFYIYQFLTSTFQEFIPMTVLIVGLSDLFDGLLARILNQHSKIGKIIDPFRDRLLAGAFLANIIFVEGIKIILSGWLFLLIASEGLIALSWIIRLTKDSMIRVNIMSKIRQTVHICCALFFLIQKYWFMHSSNIEVILILMALASLFALVSYLYILCSIHTASRC